MTVQIYELEQMLHEYIEREYNLTINDLTANGYNIDITYIPRALPYHYNHNKDEIAVQQVPGLTIKIKRDLINNFGLAYKYTLRGGKNYDYPTAYPYYMIFKIKKLKCLIEKLRYYGFTISSEQNKTKRKYNLPKYVCFDVRNTKMAGRVWFTVTLTKNGKKTNTAAKTVKEGMQYAAENRLAEKIWSQSQVDEYLATYKPEMEEGYSVELANQLSHCNTNIKSAVKQKEKVKEEPKVDLDVKAKAKRKYDLPKYVCYDMAESRNREHNVFQTQLHINGKLYKNNLPTVKEATLWVMNKMLETNQWTLQQASDYLATYKPEMENGNFIPSDTPKSPSWRKREKNKNIKTIKQKITDKLKDIFVFAEKNGIKIDVNVK